MIVVDEESKLGVQKVQMEARWLCALGPPAAWRLAKHHNAATTSRNSIELPNTTALTLQPLQISHNGSRSRSPRGYALCVSALR
jgi:hypothetical protein